MKIAVMGIVESRATAERLVDQLGAAGFAGDDISVLFADSSVVIEASAEGATKAPEGAVTGASVAGIVGTAFGFLVGFGALFIPGAGPFLAAGPILSALSVGAASAAAGGMTGALIGVGVPESEAGDLHAKISGGHLLVSVVVSGSDEQQQATTLFEAAAAQHVCATSNPALLA